MSPRPTRRRFRRSRSRHDAPVADGVGTNAPDPESIGDVATSPAGLRRTFRAFSVPNYRLFFIGQAVSVTGTWMQRVAQDWLILELGGSAFDLSLGVALQATPYLFIGLFGGVVVDRLDGRRLLLATQTLLACCAVGLGLLVMTGNVTLMVVFAAALLVGCLDVFDVPARQSFVLELVGRDSVANAVSLNSSINNVARLVGPAVAGVVITLVGTGPAFLVNAGTFSAIIVALVLMDPASLQSRERAGPGRGQVREGLRQSWEDQGIRYGLFATFLVSAFSQNFRILLPLMATVVFAHGAESYGTLMSVLGVGALGGALVCAHLSRPSMRMIAIQCLCFSAVLLAVAITPTYALIVVLMLGVGAANTSFNATANSYILLRAQSRSRGRIASIRTLVSQGSTPLGSLGVGYLCEVAGPRYGFAVGGGAALLAAVVAWRGGIAVEKHRGRLG